MSKMKNFVKEFIAVVNGDNDEAQALKALRHAESALKTQIASLTGDTISYEDAVTSAEEHLAKSRVNYGKAIDDRNTYVANLLNAKNKVTQAEESLETHKAKIKFLEESLNNLEG